MAIAELIPPALQGELKSLRLASRRAAAGGAVGAHASRWRGSGLEFAQYRAYEPGDEPRRIDWRLFARSDRLFVRESERDSNLDVWLLLDASASMLGADLARPGQTKFDAARSLLACLASIALRQGDRVGLVIVATPALQWLAPAVGMRQLDRVLLALSRATPGGPAPDEMQLRPLWQRIPQQAMVVLASDFFDPPCVEMAIRLAGAQREVLALEVLGADERDFPFRGGHRFVDPESGAELARDADSARRDYLQRFAHDRSVLRTRLAGAGVRHALHTLDAPLRDALRRLLGAQGTGP